MRKSPLKMLRPIRGAQDSPGFRTVVAVCFLLSALVAVRAALRRNYSTAEVVSRAQLIVVGRMKEGTLAFIPHSSPRGASWEHRFEMLVTEVLKGNLPTNHLFVTLEHGLDPLVDSRLSNQFAVIEFAITNPPKGEVRVFDTGASVKPPLAVTGDIRTNHIWFLRTTLGRSSARQLSVSDPEDIQPLSKRGEIIQFIRGTTNEDRSRPSGRAEHAPANEPAAAKK